MKYTTEEEELFKSNGEKAECMAILHQLSYQKYNRLSIATNVPVILLSSVVGFITTLNMFSGQEIMLGTLSLMVGFIKSLENYFSLTTRAEAHRITGLSYAKISKLIEVQLTLKREDRIVADDLLHVITNDVAALRESEPIIDNDIIRMFNKKYDKDLTCKPSIVNGLTEIKIAQLSQKDATIQVNVDEEASMSSTIQSQIQRPRWK
jgi:hypothetical protein